MRRKQIPMAARTPDARPTVAPGQVWWCDGAALAFEAYFKRRPVLVVTPGDAGGWQVIPLSSKRRFGQETAVTHAGGISYMTGALVTVPARSLVKPFGAWDGFTVWRDGPATPERGPGLLARLRAFLGR
jgi:hypothetical protein